MTSKMINKVEPFSSDIENDKMNLADMKRSLTTVVKTVITTES